MTMFSQFSGNFFHNLSSKLRVCFFSRSYLLRRMHKKAENQRKGKIVLLPRPFIVGNQWRSPQFTNLLIGSRNMVSEGQVNFGTTKKTKRDQTNNETNYGVGK